MIISLGDKFINMANVLYIEDESSHLPMVRIYFIGKKEGLHLSGDYAEKVLTYLERTAEKPFRRNKLRDELIVSAQLSFKELQTEVITLGDYIEATKNLPR